MLTILVVGAIIVGIVLLLRRDEQPFTSGCYNGTGPTNGQSAAFRATNHCCEPIWMEARAGPCSAPLPGYNQTVFKVDPGTGIDFNIPNTRIAATPFWAKWGCDPAGFNCLMGDQDPLKLKHVQLMGVHSHLVPLNLAHKKVALPG